MSESTHEGASFSKKNISQKSQNQNTIQAEKKEESPPPPSAVSEVVPYLQMKKNEGPGPYQSAIHSIHQSYGNTFMGSVARKIDRSTGNRTIYREELNEGQWAIKHSQAVAYVMEVYSGLASELARTGLAYKAAYEQHKAILDAENASDKLAMDLLFGAFGAVLGGLGGALIKDVVDSSRIYVIGGASGLASYVAKQGGSAAADVGAGQPMRPASQDPLTFYLTAQQRMLSEQSAVAGVLRQMPYNKDTDPMSTVLFYLASAKAQSAALAEKDSATLQLNCEEKIWREWLVRFGWKTYTTMSGGGCMGPHPVTRTTSVDKDIVKYLSNKFGWSEEDQQSISRGG